MATMESSLGFLSPTSRIGVPPILETELLWRHRGHGPLSSPLMKIYLFVLDRFVLDFLNITIELLTALHMDFGLKVC